MVNLDDEEALIDQFNIEGAAAEEVLGYDEDDDEEYDGSNGDNGDDSEFLDGDLGFKAFQRQVRVEETRRAEGNRRAGGIKTQRAMVKAWEVSRFDCRFITIYFLHADDHITGICGTRSG